VTENVSGPEAYYEFRNFFHPFVARAVDELKQSVPERHARPKFLQTLIRDDFFSITRSYPAHSRVRKADPKKVIDLDEDGPYANYNWELLFSHPLAVAVHSEQESAFAEAQRWFSFHLRSASNEANVPTPDRMEVLQVSGTRDTQQIDQRLPFLSKPANECSTLDLKTKALVLSGYMGILEHPFQPHRVARTRTLAYRLQRRHEVTWTTH